MDHFDREEPKHKESEIVIKITPKHLERMIYLLIIIGLAIFSVVAWFHESCDCEDPVVIETAPVIEAAPVVEETPEPVVEEEPEEEPIELSGVVDFALTDVTTCIFEEEGDNHQIDDVDVIIDNGLSRKFNGRLDLYMWAADSDSSLKQFPTRYVEDITVLSGATMVRSFDVDGGRVKSDEDERTVKVVLVDADLETVIEEHILTGISTSSACS